MLAQVLKAWPSPPATSSFLSLLSTLFWGRQVSTRGLVNSRLCRLRAISEHANGGIFAYFTVRVREKDIVEVGPARDRRTAIGEPTGLLPQPDDPGRLPPRTGSTTSTSS